MTQKTKKSNRKGIERKYLFLFIVIISIAAIGIGLTFNTSSAAVGSDPLVGYIFTLELENSVVGYFSEVTGIGSSTEVIEHKVVDQTGHETIQKIPGKTSFNTVTLKRGITSNKDMWNWRKQIEDGNVNAARRDCSIKVFDQSMTQIAQWDLGDVWPSQITQTISDDGLLEEIVIVCESVTRAQ